MKDLNFFRDKKILVTGHTGFKGTWLCMMLVKAGAQITGYALEPTKTQNLFHLSNVETHMDSVTGDIRDYNHLLQVFQKVQPEIVIHLAAQPLVIDSYNNPRYTYETNVMGTVNVCECIRNTGTVKSFLNVTTDKVYKNHEWQWGYRECEELDGHDPYSNSKSCSELVTHSYIRSFFQDMGVAVSTARAGNVIGGGDFAENRIIPDCIRAAIEGKTIEVRNPNSIRPYQHVLESLNAYLLIVQKQYQDIRYAGFYNVGPNEEDCITTGELVTYFCKSWGQGLEWNHQLQNGPHESDFLKLDCAKIRHTFGWKPRWNVQTAVDKVIEWTKFQLSGGDVSQCMNEQIDIFLERK